MQFLAKHHIVDDFLPPALHGSFIDFALAQADNFAPATVLHGNSAVVDTYSRRCHRFTGALGALAEQFYAQLSDQIAPSCAAVGVQPFTVSDHELEMIASGDGDNIARHIDTFFDSARAQARGDRILSCVYYFHVDPCQFTGGELALYSPFSPLDAPPGALVAPRQNRLVVFPSFLPHAVLPVQVASADFAAARFSVNCWLMRARAVQ